MSRESNVSGTTSSLREQSDGLPISADRPDAAPRPGDDRIRALASALALLALTALFAYTALQGPRHTADNQVSRTNPSLIATSSLTEGARHESR